MKENNLVKPDKIYTVSEITQLIKLELEGAFRLLWIEGEISNFRRPHSGHLYFTLKDEMSQLSVVIFRSEARRVPFELKDGLQVICRGRINVYEPQGKYQLITEVIEPKGKGALQLAFEQLKERLKNEGLFDPRFKKKLPLLPKKVGLVTSRTGAAIIDILRTLERRFARIHIVIYPVRVQGEGAAEEIVEGIDYLSSLPDIDVIIVSRGGGSIEDLWAFNEEAVARAIWRCEVPVISAVGHEIDFTISDFVADIRASTPSVAAEMVIEKEEAFVDRIENLERRMIHYQQYFLQGASQRVFSLIHHRAFQDFRLKLLNLQQKIDKLEMSAWDAIKAKHQMLKETKSQVALLEEKMNGVLKRRLQNLLGTWQRLAAQLHNLSPLNILKKGYALCWSDGTQRLIRRIEEVKKEEDLTVSFYKGEFVCFVKDVDRAKLIESRLRKEKK